MRNLLKRRLKTRWTAPTLIGLGIVYISLLMLQGAGGWLSELNSRLEWMAYDLRMQISLSLSAGVELDPLVTIVDIDERSLQAEGHWPWPRRRIAALADRLFDAGAAVVAFDVVFPETEPNPADRVMAATPPDIPVEFLQQLGALGQQLDGDRVLGEALSGRPAVLGFLMSNQSQTAVGVLPIPVAEITSETGDRLSVARYAYFTANNRALQQAAPSGGFFMVEPDGDGVIRRSALVARHADALFPSLALAAVHEYYGAPGVGFNTVQVGDRLRIDGLEIPGLEHPIPTDQEARVIIPFRGPEGSYRYLSASDVLNGDFQPEVVQDTIVLIGTTAAGLFDLRATPVQNVFPGVEVHANIISGLLNNDFPIVTSAAEGLDIFMILGVGLVFALVFPHLRVGWLLAIAATVILAYLALNFWLWSQRNIVTSVALPMLALSALAALNIAWGYIYESRSRNKLKDVFGQYVPKALVEKLNQNPGMSLGFEGETREMSVLFCDIRGFTGLSENLSANELKKMLNFFFTPMTQIIFNRHGTIDKYIGDLIMAFWGAPLPDENHRRHAVDSALRMLEAVDEMQDELTQQGWPEIRVGVGVNSGPMNVGDMGSIYRRNYTVLGDAVNLGSRLEGLTKFYRVTLVVSEFTREGLDDIAFRPLDRVRVKGRSHPVNIFQPLGPAEELSETEKTALATHQQAMHAYYQRRWDQAEALWRELAAADPQAHLYSLYLERIATLRENPPAEDWDGAYTHTSK